MDRGGRVGGGHPYEEKMEQTLWRENDCDNNIKEQSKTRKHLKNTSMVWKSTKIRASHSTNFYYKSFGCDPTWLKYVYDDPTEEFVPYHFISFRFNCIPLSLQGLTLDHAKKHPCSKAVKLTCVDMQGIYIYILLSIRKTNGGLVHDLIRLWDRIERHPPPKGSI